MFPAESVPDNAIIAPHHFYTGCLIMAIAIATCWDDYRDHSPWVSMAGVITALYGFISVWAFYQSWAGPVMAFVGLTVTLLAVLYRWQDYYPLRARKVVVLGYLIALDDLISHGLGVWTPLDWFWGAYIRWVVVL